MEPGWLETTTEYIELEYRVAVLEGIVSWLLSNGVLTRPLASDDLSQIYGEAAESIRSRHPNADIAFRYEYLPRDDHGAFRE